MEILLVRIFLMFKSKIKSYNNLNTNSSQGLKTLGFPWRINYEKNYENVISQLKFSSDDVINLNSTEFQNYILDEWSFSKKFYMSSSNYTSHASLSISNQTKISKYVDQY